MGRLTLFPRAVTGRVVRPGAWIAGGLQKRGNQESLGPELVVNPDGVWERDGSGSAVSLYQSGALLELGKRYRISGTLQHPVGAQASWRIGTNGAPWLDEGQGTGQQLSTGTGSPAYETFARVCNATDAGGELRIYGNTNGVGGTVTGVSCREVQDALSLPVTRTITVGIEPTYGGYVRDITGGFSETGVWGYQVSAAAGAGPSFPDAFIVCFNGTTDGGWRNGLQVTNRGALVQSIEATLEGFGPITLSWLSDPNFRYQASAATGVWDHLAANDGNALDLTITGLT